MDLGNLGFGDEGLRIFGFWEEVLMPLFGYFFYSETIFSYLNCPLSPFFQTHPDLAVRLHFTSQKIWDFLIILLCIVGRVNRGRVCWCGFCCYWHRKGDIWHKIGDRWQATDERWLIKRVILFLKSSNYLHSQTVRARDLKFWDNVHHHLCVMCHVSCVMCHMSCVRRQV